GLRIGPRDSFHHRLGLRIFGCRPLGGALESVGEASSDLPCFTFETRLFVERELTLQYRSPAVFIREALAEHTARLPTLDGFAQLLGASLGSLGGTTQLDRIGLG